MLIEYTNTALIGGLVLLLAGMLISTIQVVRMCFGGNPLDALVNGEPAGRCPGCSAIVLHGQKTCTCGADLSGIWLDELNH